MASKIAMDPEKRVAIVPLDREKRRHARVHWGSAHEIVATVPQDVLAYISEVERAFMTHWTDPTYTDSLTLPEARFLFREAVLLAASQMLHIYQTEQTGRA